MSTVACETKSRECKVIYETKSEEVRESLLKMLESYYARVEITKKKISGEYVIKAYFESSGRLRDFIRFVNNLAYKGLEVRGIPSIEQIEAG